MSKIRFIDVGNGVRINADLVDEIKEDRIILYNGEVIFYNEFPKVERYVRSLYDSYGREEN